MELSRLHCHCAFTEGARRLEQLIEEAASSAKVAKLKAAVSELRKLHEAHVAEYGPAYGRSLLELSKQQATGLQATAYGAKEVLAHREPPKKRTKKQHTMEQKKRKTHATSAALKHAPTK
jgi:hypothetical protein